MTPRRHPPPRPALAAALAAAAALALPACKRGGSQPQVTQSNDPTAPVRTGVAAATARQIDDVLSASGSLMADMQSEVTPLVAGRVMQVLVERGQRVREGDPLIRLRDVDFRTTQAQAQATLGQARARLGLEGGRAFNPEETAEVRAAAAQRDIADDARRRAEQLYGSGSISDAELQRARASADAATAQYRSALNGMRGAYFAYQQASAVAQQASRALADSVVRAPFAGEVAERRINVGEYVTPQRAIALLVKTDALRMEIQVPQERIAQVRRDQRVEVRVDAFPDRVFAGTIRYISAAVRADTRSLIAEAVVPNADGTLRPGLFATARLQLPQQERVVVVPADAVISEAGSHRVYVIANGVAQERVVTLAERNAREALISRGVEPNELVAHGEIARLSDGARVQ